MRGLSRRTSLRIAAAAVGTIAAPRIVSRESLASDGELSLLGWAEYVPPEMIKAFTESTGIKVTLRTFGSTEEMMNMLRAFGGDGPDVVYVESRWASTLAAEGLLSSWEGIDAEAGATLPSILLASDQMGGMVDGTRFAAPLTWSTEALSFKRASVDVKEASYAQLWNPDGRRGITFRIRSALNSAGLLLESERKIASMGLLYESEEAARSVLEPASQIVIANKPSVKSFWDQAGEAASAMADDAVDLGQITEYAGFEVGQKIGFDKVGYVSPPEGAIGWIDSMGLSSAIKNREEAKAWLSFNLKGPVAGGLAQTTLVNSAAREALANLSGERQEFLKAAHPVIIADSGGANDPCPKLNQCRCEDRSCAENCCRNRVVAGNVYWPRLEPNWLIALRTQYVDKIQAA